MSVGLKSRAMRTPSAEMENDSLYLVVYSILAKLGTVIATVHSRCGRALDTVVCVLCNVLYILRARCICGGKYIHRVAVSHGPAQMGRPRALEANIVDMRRRHSQERYTVITRGHIAPEWALVEDNTKEHESTIMCAELHAHHQSGGLEVVDITPLVYHLPHNLMVSPEDICALVLGRRDAESCSDARVEIMMLDRSITFRSHEIVTSEVTI